MSNAKKFICNDTRFICREAKQAKLEKEQEERRLEILMELEQAEKERVEEAQARVGHAQVNILCKLNQKRNENGDPLSNGKGWKETNSDKHFSLMYHFIFLSLQEMSKNFITLENLDMEVEKALNMKSNYNYSIDLKGKKYLEMADGSVKAEDENQDVEGKTELSQG